MSSGPRVPFLVATGLSVAAGLLCSLAFPPAELWPLAFLAPAVLLLLLRDARPARGFALGLLFGLGFFGATLYWIWRFGTLAWFALTSVSALAVAIFGALLPAVSRPGATIRNAAGAAALWTVIDWIRGAWPLGGFTWGSLGISQVDNRALLPLASVTGVWGVTFVVVAAASLLADAGGGAGLRRAGRAGLAVVLVVAPALIPFPRADGPALDVAALQVDVRVGAATSSAAEDLTVARRLVALERTLIGGARPDLVVWGEGSLDPAASADPATVSAVQGAIRAVGAPTSIGAVVNDADGPQRTTDLVFDPEGALVDRYDKVHLVPFGEYVPWRRWLGWVQAIGQIPVDRTPGTGVHTVVAPGLPPFATPICFENAFPALTRAFARDGATFFVVPVNNASYGFTAASDQHLQMSRMRAVETGRWFVDAAVSGVSAFIDPAGQVTEHTELFQTTVMRGTVQSSSAPTWYVRLGDWVPWLALVAAIGLFLAPPRPRRGMRRRSAVAPAGAPRTLVVLPTYEERHTIETVVSRVLALPEHVDIVVVDDSSPDGTGQVVRAIAAAEPRVRLIERPVKSGLGSAYLEGFRLALDEGYDLGVEMDSDLSHDPAELSRLLDAARGEDLVVGSRYVPGGSVSNWSRPRVWLSRAGNAYARLMLGVPIHDATSGYRAYRRDLLEDLLTRPMTSDGYGFQIELVMRAHLDGFAVGEVPITFREREHGRSKISRRIVVEALWSVTRWGMALRLGREPGAPKGEPPSKTGARDRRSAAGVL